MARAGDAPRQDIDFLLKRLDDDNDLVRTEAVQQLAKNAKDLSHDDLKLIIRRWNEKGLFYEKPMVDLVHGLSEEDKTFAAREIAKLFRSPQNSDQALILGKLGPGYVQRALPELIAYIKTEPEDESGAWAMNFQFMIANLLGRPEAFSDELIDAVWQARHYAASGYFDSHAEQMSSEQKARLVAKADVANAAAKLEAIKADPTVVLQALKRQPLSEWGSPSGLVNSLAQRVPPGPIAKEIVAALDAKSPAYVYNFIGGLKFNPSQEVVEQVPALLLGRKDENLGPEQIQQKIELLKGLDVPETGTELIRALKKYPDELGIAWALRDWVKEHPAQREPMNKAYLELIRDPKSSGCLKSQLLKSWVPGKDALSDEAEGLIYDNIDALSKEAAPLKGDEKAEEELVKRMSCIKEAFDALSGERKFPSSQFRDRYLKRISELTDLFNLRENFFVEGLGSNIDDPNVRDFLFEKPMRISGQSYARELFRAEGPSPRAIKSLEELAKHDFWGAMAMSKENERDSSLRGLVLQWAETKPEVKKWLAELSAGQASEAIVAADAIEDRLQKGDQELRELVAGSIEAKSQGKGACEVICQAANETIASLMSEPTEGLEAISMSADRDSWLSAIKNIKTLYLVKSAPYCKLSAKFTAELIKALRAPKKESKTTAPVEAWIRNLRNHLESPSQIPRSSSSMYSSAYLSALISELEATQSGDRELSKTLHGIEAKIRVSQGKALAMLPELGVQGSLFNTFLLGTMVTTLPKESMKEEAIAKQRRTMDEIIMSRKNALGIPYAVDAGKEDETPRAAAARDVPFYLACFTHPTIPSTLCRERLLASLDNFFAFETDLQMHSSRPVGTHWGDDHLAPYYYYPTLPALSGAIGLLSAQTDPKSKEGEHLAELRKKALKGILRMHRGDSGFAPMGGDLYRETQYSSSTEYVGPLAALGLLPLAPECANFKRNQSRLGILPQSAAEAPRSYVNEARPDTGAPKLEHSH